MGKFLKLLLLSLTVFLVLNVNLKAEEIEIKSDIQNNMENTNTETADSENNSVNENLNILYETTNETTTNTTNEEISDIHGGEIYDIQKVKVIIKKVDENGNLLSGAKLQILNSNGDILEEWISNDKVHETLLPDGTYILHEEEAPKGYDIAENKEFVVKVEIAELNAGVDVDPEVCDHYQDGNGNYGVILYYVEIENKKHEVYCINQELGTPDENSIYDGEILNSTDIRNYTIQTVKSDAHNNEETKDISDQSLTDQELYDKILDIIYHRHKAASLFPDLNDTEIRYITELALKNYTNTGLTQTQRVSVSQVPENYDKYDYYTTEDGKYVWYLYPMYRSFVYLPEAQDGEDIFTTSLGNGNSFGNLARHWNGNGHNAKTDPLVREQVSKYYELYKYLVNDENDDGNPDHPSDMNLYIYSTDMLHKYIYKGVEYTEPYQNLLGVTGYFEDIKQQEQEVEMVNNYSTETRNITVTKIWDDRDNYNKKRPQSVTINLYANKELSQTIELNETNNWSYTFDNLAVYNNGSKIIYEINEIEVKNYFTEIKGNMEIGFTITNSCFGEGGDIPPSNNPNTYDNISTYILMLIFSGICISILGYIYNRDNE